MQIVIPNNSWIVFEGISPDVENALLKRFSVRHPRARYMDASNWDGWYKRYYVDKQAMARPFLKEVREMLDDMHVPYEVIDGRANPRCKPDESLIKPDLLPGIVMEDYQMDALRAMCREECGIISSTTGCHPAGQGILLYDGSIKRVENVEIGDLLMGPDNQPRKVLKTITGSGAIFKIIPVRGDPFYANGDHILTLVKTGVASNEIVDVSIREWMLWSDTKKHLYKLFRVPVDQFDGQCDNLPIDAYLLGALLGDGGMLRSIKFFCSKDDPEVLERVSLLASVGGLTCRAGASQRESSKCVEYLISGSRRKGRNWIVNALRDMNLMGSNSGNKFIPSIYKTASREDRLKILAGLLDTDGHLSDGAFEYVTKSAQLADDVAFISRSLGFMAVMAETYKHDQHGNGGLYHRLSISGNVSEIPVRLPRKKAAPRRQKKNNLRTGFSIEKSSDYEQYFGFTLDSDGRYLMEDFTVTHNSGKTELMAGIVKITNAPTVILADIRVVIEQIKERLELRDVDGGEVGLFYAGERPSGQKVVVGSIQSLSTPTRPDPESDTFKDEETGVFLQDKYDKAMTAYKTRLRGAKEFQRLVNQADLLLVDECDKAASSNYKDLFFKNFNGRYKFGFSGTPKDDKKPVEWLFLRERMGSVIFHIDRKSVEATGRIIPVKCVMMAVGDESGKSDKAAYDIAETENVIKNDAFHELVKGIVDSFPNDRTLIIVDTHEIKSLGAALEQKIPGSKFIHGPTATKERRAAIKAFEDGELKCLIGGKIIKRGLDLRGGADNVILIGGGTKWSNIDQMVGRAVRKNARGWCRVFGFYHQSNYYLYAHSREQLKAIVAMGYDTTVVFPTGPVKGADLVKSRFRVRTPRAP